MTNFKYIIFLYLDNTYKDCRVRREKVLNAILWLIQNNPFYKSVQVDHVALQALPDDGIPGDLLTIDDPNDSLGDNDPPHKDQAAGNAQLQHDHVSANEFADQVSSFIPLPQRKPQEEAAIRSAIKEQDPLDWPVNTGDPINEFQTSGLASMAFPTLFPYGRADPTNKGREREMFLLQKVSSIS